MQPVRVFLIALTLTQLSLARSIVTSGDKVRTFLGNKTGKVVYISNGELFCVDFSQNALTETSLGKYTGLGLRSRLSYDGTRVVFAAGGKVYVRKTVAAATPKEIGAISGVDGGCTWWVHPSTKKEYVLFPRSGTGIMIREVDLSGTPVGQEQKLFGVTEADGGRSPDGRFLGSINQTKNSEGIYRGHGIYEIAQPYDGVANLTLRTHHLTTEMGYCNGTMSIAGPSHKFYGCILALGGGHVRLEFYKFKPMPGSFSYLTETFLVSDSARSMFAGKTEFHGMGWSTHPSYVATAVLTDRASKGLDDVYLCNVDTLDTLKRSRVKPAEIATRAFIRITSGGGQGPHLWIEGSDALLDAKQKSPGTAIGTRGLVVDIRGSSLVARIGGGTVSSLFLKNSMGRTVRSVRAMTQMHVLDLHDLPAGVYLLELKSRDRHNYLTSLVILDIAKIVH